MNGRRRVGKKQRKSQEAARTAKSHQEDPELKNIRKFFGLSEGQKLCNATKVLYGVANEYPSLRDAAVDGRQHLKTELGKYKNASEMTVDMVADYLRNKITIGVLKCKIKDAKEGYGLPDIRHRIIR